MDAQSELPWGEKEKGKDKDKEMKRMILRIVLLVGFSLTMLYEYHQRYPSRESDYPTDAAGLEEQRLDGLNFAEELRKAKQEPGVDFDLAHVKEEFVEKYHEGAKALLCSACKLTADQIGDELHARNASGVPEPVALLGVTKEANEAACENLPKPLVIFEKKKGGMFFDHADKALTGVEQRKADVARKSAQRLCIAALEDARWAMLEALIRHKVPHAKKRWGSFSGSNNDNWERWLCAKRLRLCKRSEVQDDDEGDDPDEL